MVYSLLVMDKEVAVRITKKRGGYLAIIDQPFQAGTLVIDTCWGKGSTRQSAVKALATVVNQAMQKRSYTFLGYAEAVVRKGPSAGQFQYQTSFSCS